MMTPSKTDASIGLSFGRTVERKLVHRSALAEVFVTDMRQTGESEYLAGAQLPLSHAYYNDHRQDPALFDTLLLLESSRQAAIYGTHAYLDLPLTTSFLVNTLSIRLDDLDTLTTGVLPSELHIATRYPRRRVRAGRIRDLDIVQELRMDDVHLGDVTMTVSAMTPDEYAAVRRVQRCTAAPLTTDFQDRPGDPPVAPHRVGRNSLLNVVITEPARDVDTVSARLKPPFSNRSLFDHAYDHFPAMVLMEAARQLAFWSLDSPDDGAQRPTERIALAGMTATFLRIAELDSPVRISAGIPAGAGTGTYEIGFTQESTTIAEATVTLAPIAASMTDRDAA